MSRKVAVIVDGPAAVPPALIDEYDMRVLPLHVIADGDDYLETEVDMEWLLSRLRQRDRIPSTSAASVGETLRCYEWAAERASAAISIHVSSAFSKSYGAALEARKLALQEFPHMQIEVIDSMTAEAGELPIAVECARLASEGANFSEVVQRAYQIRDSMCLLYCFETLFYRDKGGRIFQAKAWANAENESATSFRTLARVDHSTGGIVKPVCRAKTKQQLLKKMVQVAAEHLDGCALSGAIVHVNAADDARNLKKQLQESLWCDSVLLSHASAASTVHSGEGFLTFGFHPSAQASGPELVAQGQHTPLSYAHKC